MTYNYSNDQGLPFFAAIYTSLICISFGSNAVAIKMTLKGMGPFTTAGIRFGIAAVVIYIWARLTRRNIAIRKEQLIPVLITSVLFTVELALLYLGLNKTNASRGTLLINLQPFMVLFLAHIFIPEERITKKNTLGLLLGFTGLTLFFLSRKGVTTSIQIGDSIILLGALIWAIQTVYIKKIIDRYSPFHLVMYPMIIATPFFILAGFFWDNPMVSDVNLTVIGSLLYQSLISAAFGYVAWNNLLQKYGAVSLHSFLFIMPIAGVFLGVLILDEPITINILGSMLLIATGIIIVNSKIKV
jgi:drug/metabolite transporter (DMT)-like permease